MSLILLVLCLVGAAMVTASALMVLGAFVPRLPYLGALGSLIWPTLIGPAVLFSTVAVLLVLIALLVNGGVLASVMLIVGALAWAGTLVIFASQVAAAGRAGVPVGLKVFTATSLGPKEPEDASAVYAHDADGNPLRLIMYRPRSLKDDPAPGLPVIVYVHGGGWFQGAPDENPAMLRWLADQGYLVVAPEYSLATDERPTWDIAMPQIGCALVWIAEHAPEHGADPDRIAVWGASAGANLALAATYAAAAEKLTLPCRGDFPRIAAVAGEVPAVDPWWVSANTDPIWGDKTAAMVARYLGGDIEDHPDRLAAIRVNTYLSPAAPPTFLSVSSGDHLVPVEGIRQFVDEAERAGVQIDTFYRRWGDHVIGAIYEGLSCQTMLRQLLKHFRRHGV